MAIPRRVQWILWLWIPFFFLVGCGTTGMIGSHVPPVVPENLVFRPLDTYKSPAARDLAQLLYPAFQKIREDLQHRFQNHSLRYLENGFEVIHLGEESEVQPGFYIHLKLFSTDNMAGKAGFVSQAEQLTAKYLPAVFFAMSRDWDQIFGQSLTGTVVEFYWNAHTHNRLRCIIQNMDIQEYLNKKMTLQELVDKNWIEGWQGESKLGRIELNALQPAPI